MSKRPLGRPPLEASDDEIAHVHVRLPARTYDKAYGLARRAGVTVPEVFRRALERELEAGQAAPRYLK